MFLQEKEVGTLHMLPDIGQTQPNDSNSKDPDDQDGLSVALEASIFDDWDYEILLH